MCSSAVNIKLKITPGVMTQTHLCEMEAYVTQRELDLQLIFAHLPRRCSEAAIAYPIWRSDSVFSPVIVTAMLRILQIHMHYSMYMRPNQGGCFQITFTYFFLLGMKLKTRNSWSCND